MEQAFYVLFPAFFQASEAAHLSGTHQKIPTVKKHFGNRKKRRFDKRKILRKNGPFALCLRNNQKDGAMKGKNLLVSMLYLNERDINSVFPVLFYLEKLYSYKTVIRNSLDLKEFEKDYTAVLFANINGSSYNFRSAVYAGSVNLPIVYLEPEGNFVEDRLDEFFWGVNARKNRFIDKHFLWSEKSRQMVLKKYPELSDYTDVSGATGLDRYQNFSPSPKETLLKNFKKVITYACFGFDKVFLDERFAIPDQNLVRGDLKKVKNILLETIGANPEILFILRIHPQQFDFRYIEIGLDWDKIYPNVLILKNEEELQDLLGACDLWLSYESTTTLETWCMKKETVMLIPSPCYSWRTNLYRGSSVARNSGELKMLIDEYYSHGSIRQFEEKKKTREEIITDSIGSADGLNAFRTAKKIDEFLKKTARERNINLGQRLLSSSVHLILKISRKAHFLKIFRQWRTLQGKVLSIDTEGEAAKQKYFARMEKSSLVRKSLRKT